MESIDDATFTAVKKILRDQSVQLQAKVKREIAGEMTKASTRLGKTLGDDSIKIASDDFSGLGVFEETADSISFAALQTISAQSGEHGTSHRQALASCAIHLHGKVLLATAYSYSVSPADAEWVKAQIREWARRVRALNP